MAFTRERIDEIIDSLRGTCRSLIDFLEDQEDEDDTALLEAIDQDLFCCDQCNWWCEQSEAHEGTSGDVCDDCHSVNHSEGDEEDEA